MRGNSKGRYTFIMLAGVYLLYLGWQLISGYRSGEAASPIFPLAAVFFFIAGILIIVSNIRQIMKISAEESTADNETSETDIESENAVDVNSIAENTADDDTAVTDDTAEDLASSVSKKSVSLFDRANLRAASDTEEE